VRASPACLSATDRGQTGRRQRSGNRAVFPAQQRGRRHHDRECCIGTGLPAGDTPMSAAALGVTTATPKTASRARVRCDSMSAVGPRTAEDAGRRNSSQSGQRSGRAAGELTPGVRRHGQRFHG